MKALRWYGKQNVRVETVYPSFVISHRMSLDEAPQGYDMFAHKTADSIKVLITP